MDLQAEVPVAEEAVPGKSDREALEMQFSEKNISKYRKYRQATHEFRPV